MMKMRMTTLVLVACVMGFGVFGCSKPLPPVTEIQIAGMPLDTKTEIFSSLTTPVVADAVVQVPGKQDRIIVNVFPAAADGTIASGAAPEVIMVTETDNFKLDKTMSKKKLAPGTYLMNIVYSGKTERVLFTVKE
jgi:hypothetical protein